MARGWCPMKRPDVTTTWPLLGVLLLLPACGDDAGGTAGGGTEGEGGDNPVAGPDPHGNQCGNTVKGWQTSCFVQDVTAASSAWGAVPGAPPVGGYTGRSLCCEGAPSEETADGGCESICVLEACEAALLDHLAHCETCSWSNCGFDMSKCLQGGTHTQTMACLTPIGLYSYDLTIACSAFNNELRHPDGTFEFLEQPTNHPNNDPPICQPVGGLGHSPPRGLGQYTATESDGTLARVTWSISDTGGQQQSDALDVRLEYGLTPCAVSTNDCVELAALELTIPTTQALGLTITNARLEVVSVTGAPVLERGQHFRFADGALGVLVQASVDGMPVVLTGRNVGNIDGWVAPAGDQLSLSGLRFEFQDGVITAALEIEIQGRYLARRPNAQITGSTPPASCDEPVAWLATSWDDDHDPLTHTWWVRGVGSFSGPLLEVVLPPGDYDVTLISQDPSGLFDGTSLRYSRRCQ